MLLQPTATTTVFAHILLLGVWLATLTVKTIWNPWVLADIQAQNITMKL